ncbi:hypothetical protein IJG90_00155 [Candidatus Saccharibacteria bacterium]|nr:hypothetical protein [Candidatus Saccharibacteria bacterium]
MDIIFTSREPNRELEEITKKTGALPEDQKIQIALAALSNIHDVWVNTNTKKFFDPTREGKRYMFLPLEFIGVEEAMKDYIFVEDILTLLCLKPERYHLEQAIRKARNQFATKRGIKTRDDLIGYICSGYYMALPATIADAVGDRKVATKIADQVIEKSGNPASW